MTPIIVTENPHPGRARRRRVAAGIVAGVLLVLVTSIPAAVAGRGVPTTLNGSCELTGTVRFKPPLTNASQPGRVRGRLRGECSGTLTDRRGTRSIDGQRVRSAVHSGGLESCGAGRGEGAGFLQFRTSRLRFTYEEVRTGSVLALDATGTRGGSAAVEGNVSPSADPGSILEACGSDGLRHAPVDARLATAPEFSG